MKVLRTVRVAATGCVFLLAGSTIASAEIVFLTSGRTLSVKSHRESGDSITLTLRSGGEVTCDKTLVEKIVPDEVPHPDPADVAPAPPKLVAPPLERGLGLKVSPYTDMIVNTAETYGVDPILVQALVQVESDYQPRARSSKGAMGLMQLMPSVAKEYRVRNAYDPKANVEAGVQKLKSLLEKYGSEGVNLALAAYNAGEGAVTKFNGVPPYRETQSYVTRILALAGLSH
jgi:soluble lytic murein transglycosylase-like protein